MRIIDQLRKKYPTYNWRYDKTHIDPWVAYDEHGEVFRVGARLNYETRQVLLYTAAGAPVNIPLRGELLNVV